MANDVDIVLEIGTIGVDKIHNLSNALQQLHRTLEGAKNPMRNLDARSKALSKAVGGADSSLKNHAKTVAELTRNQSILSNELGRVEKDIRNIGKTYQFAAGTSKSFKKQAVQDLKDYQHALSQVKARALVSDLKAVAQEQKRLGKDAQFVGRSLIIGLTTPIVGFGRLGLQSLVALDREIIRLNKVLESVAPNIDLAAKKTGIDLANATDAQRQRLDKMVQSYNELNGQLTATSTKFGLAKSITVGLAADFAELGIQTTESIAAITELTAETEKLGGMDIGPAKDLIQSLYFQAVRAMQMSGESLNMTFEEREKTAIGAAKAQLNFFNLIENQTALTLKDLGDAFPEVAAAASSFGLSMTEAASMLAPMKAAGFEVGASANAIKVSLQRVTAPTKQNAEMFKQLSKQYDVNFELIKGSGLDAIQNLIDGFNELKTSAAGQEGAMEFMAKVFGVRQGPRMEVAISQLAEMDTILKSTSIGTERAEKALQNMANEAIASANKATNANLPMIQSYRDMGIIARIATATAGQEVEGFSKSVTQSQIRAARGVREAVGDLIFTKSQVEGIDLIGQVGTEAGKAMFVQLAGVENAQKVASRELEIALTSLDTQLGKIRNNFKMFAADILQGIKPAIEKLAEVTTELYQKWQQLAPQTKQLISNLVIGFAVATAAIGPLVFVFGQFRLAMGTIGKVLFGFLPSLKTMSVESIAAGSKLLRLSKPLTVVGDTVINTNGKFATFIATLASGTGPVAKFAEKLGVMTGALQAQTTAPAQLIRKISAPMNQAAGTMGMVAGAPAGGLVPGMDPAEAKRIMTSRLTRQQLESLGYPKRGGRGPGGMFSAPTNAMVTRAMELQAQGVKSSYPVARGPRGRMQRLNINEINALKAFEDAQETLRSRSVATRVFRKKDIGLDMMTGQKTFKGRDISDQRATDIFRGGAAGMRARTAEFAQRRLDPIKGGVGKITKLPSNVATGYTASINGARGALKALHSQHAAVGAGSPRMLARMTTAMRGFATATSLGTKSIKLMKIALISSGIGALILGIGVGVLLVKNNMDNFAKAGKKGFDTIGRVVNTLKSIFEELARPIVDLFASFSNGEEGAAGAASGIGVAFNALAKVIEFVANMVKWFVTNIVQPYLYGIVNIVKFVVNIFQGKWKEALLALGAAFANIFGGIAKVVLTVVGFLVKQVINYFFEIPTALAKAFAWGIEQATNLFFGFVEWVLGQVKRIPVLGRFLGGVGDAALGGLKTARDTYVGVIRGVANAVNGAGDFIKRGIDKGVNAAKKGIDKLAQSGVKRSKGGLKLFDKDQADDELDDVADSAQEKISNATGTGMEEGAEEGAKKIAAKLRKELIKELQELIVSKIKDKMDSIVDTLTEALKNQKEASLKIYDDELKKIDDLQKAEERLTKVKEYENRRREIEEKRALNALNFARQKALAIYEGRIDDARQISLEQVESERDSSRELVDLNADRAKQIADEQRQDLVDSINEAKKKAGEYFDDMIKKFQDGAKKITEFPPTTAQEFNDMLNKLINGGGGFEGARSVANNMGTTFNSTFTGVLANLGINSTQPLTDSLTTIGDTLVKNNPFGPEGVWQTTINDSITALTNKYTGLANTLSIIVDESSAEFKKLFDVYSKYKAMVEEESGSTTGGGATGGGAPGGGTTGGGTTGGGTGQQDSLRKRASDAFYKKYPNYRGPAAPQIIDYVETIFKYHKAQYSTQGTTALQKFIKNNKDWNKGIKKLGYEAAAARLKEPGNKFQYGGLVPKYPSTPVPAILHGGEYVVNAQAVRNIGLATLQQMNAMRFATPNSPKAPSVGNTYHEQNININVDTFIGERAWFESMMKDYNLTVSPQNQKNAGLQNRKISTYTGINRGM